MTSKKRLLLFALGLVAMLSLALVVRAGLPVPARAAAQACVPGPHHGTIMPTRPGAWPRALTCWTVL